MTKPFKRDVIFHNKPSIAHDGQHRHGHERANVEISKEGMLVVSRHLKQDGCVKLPVTPNTQFPLHFVMDDDDSTKATIVCGICNKEIGTCLARINRDE